MTKKTTESGNHVPAVERTVCLLRILAARGPLSLAALVEEGNINKSTAFYILRTLTALDIVEYNERDRTYMLGIGVLELSSSAYGHLNDIAIVKRYLSDLLESFDVSIVLYHRVNQNEITLIDKLERAHRVRISLQAGARVPIQGGSFGRAFLAFDSPEEVDQVLRDGLYQFTPKSITDIDAFKRELMRVRLRGWAIDHEGFALGVSTVAAPIFRSDGRIVMVAAAVGFANVLNGDIAIKCGEALRSKCDRIGDILSHDGTAQADADSVAAPPPREPAPVKRRAKRATSG